MKKLNKLFLLSFLTLFLSMTLGSSNLAVAADVATSWGTDKLGNGTQVPKAVGSFATDMSKQSKKVAYGVGGLGAVALGALAFFGRFQWGWFFGLIGGLVLITLYGVGVQSITNDTDPFSNQ